MKCKKCNKDHDGTFGSGMFCSRGCANSRGPRTKEVKEKIRKSNILAAKNRNADWLEKVTAANKDSEKINKVKATWIKKRDFASAHITSKKRYLKEEIAHCECCGLDSWMGQNIPLEVHHIDGDTNNNTRNNLTVLCCNCHAQTGNWRRKNLK